MISISYLSPLYAHTHTHTGKERGGREGGREGGEGGREGREGGDILLGLLIGSSDEVVE